MREPACILNASAAHRDSDLAARTNNNVARGSFVIFCRKSGHACPHPGARDECSARGIHPAMEKNTASRAEHRDKIMRGGSSGIPSLAIKLLRSSKFPWAW